MSSVLGLVDTWHLNNREQLHELEVEQDKVEEEPDLKLSELEKVQKRRERRHYILRVSARLRWCILGLLPSRRGCLWYIYF